MFFLFLNHIFFYWSSVLLTFDYKFKKPTLSTFEVMPIVLYNQFLITSLFMFFVSFFYKLEYNITTFTIRWCITGFIRILCALLSLNMYFGTFHYICHKNKILYNYIHRIHHKMIISCGAGAIYCHPLEHIFINIMSLAFGSILFLGNDLILNHIMVAYVSYTIVQSHTVFVNNDSINTGSVHAIHHKELKYNFDNSPYIIDRYLGTHKTE